MYSSKLAIVALARKISRIIKGIMNIPKVRNKPDKKEIIFDITVFLNTVDQNIATADKRDVPRNIRAVDATISVTVIPPIINIIDMIGSNKSIISRLNSIDERNLPKIIVLGLSCELNSSVSVFCCFSDVNAVEVNERVMIDIIANCQNVRNVKVFLAYRDMRVMS